MASPTKRMGPPINDEHLPPNLEKLRHYVPEGVAAGVVKYLRPNATPGHENELLEVLDNLTHSPTGTAKQVIVIDNLTILYQTFLFFGEFIPNTAEFTTTLRDDAFAAQQAADLQTIKLETNIMPATISFVHIQATAILKMLDMYQKMYRTRLGAINGANSGLHPSTLKYDEKTELLHELMRMWYNFRTKDYCKMKDYLSSSRGTHDSMLASRLIQWREIMMSDRKEVLFQAVVVPPSPLHPRVAAKRPDATITALTLPDSYATRMATIDPLNVQPIAYHPSTVEATQRRRRSIVRGTPMVPSAAEKSDLLSEVYKANYQLMIHTNSIHYRRTEEHAAIKAREEEVKQLMIRLEELINEACKNFTAKDDGTHEKIKKMELALTMMKKAMEDENPKQSGNRVVQAMKDAEDRIVKATKESGNSIVQAMHDAEEQKAAKSKTSHEEILAAAKKMQESSDEVRKLLQELKGLNMSGGVSGT